MTQEQTKIWYDHDDDRLVRWYEGYQKRKVQKAKIKKELLLIAWHTSRGGISECQKKKKKRQKIFRGKRGPF